MKTQKRGGADTGQPLPSCPGLPEQLMIPYNATPLFLQQLNMLSHPPPALPALLDAN